MINEELTVVHAVEDLHVSVRAYSQQMFYLRFGGKRFLRTVPEMDICAEYAL